jgi:hypothetical protein
MKNDADRAFVRHRIDRRRAATGDILFGNRFEIVREPSAGAIFRTVVDDDDFLGTPGKDVLTTSRIWAMLPTSL